MAEQNDLAVPSLKHRESLLEKVRILSVDTAYDFFQLIQPHNQDGTPRGPIVVNAYGVELDLKCPDLWQKTEVRDLWRESIHYIPEAVAVESEQDYGFTNWLWTQTQRIWTVRQEMGYAVTPYTMWFSALATGCAGEQVVNSNPRLATAIEVSLIAGHASRIAENGEKSEEFSTQCRRVVIEAKQAFDDATRAESPDLWKVQGKLSHALREYRRAEIERVKLQSMAEVVAGYERMLIPRTFATMPKHQGFSAESMAHMRLAAIEMENLANSTKSHPSELLNSVRFLTTVLDDLLCWSVHPDPKPLGDDWLTAIKTRLFDRTESVIQSAEKFGQSVLVKKADRARKLGFEFATLLCDRPALSTVPIEEWTVPKYRRLFDDLDSLNADFHQMEEPRVNIAGGETTRKLQGRRSRKTNAPDFKPEQLEAVRNIIQNNPNMKTADIKAKLEEAGGTGIGNDRLQLVLDHIRENYPKEYTVPPRKRRKDS